MKLRVVAEKPAGSLDPLRNALGVIEAVYTYRNLDLVCLGFDLPSPFHHGIRLGLGRESMKIDADGERLNMSVVAGAKDHAAVAPARDFHRGDERAYAGNEISLVASGLHPEQIVSQQIL